MQRKLEFMACFKEQHEKKMNSLKSLLVVVVVVCSFPWTSVDGSMSNSRKTGPSPPRNLRRSVVGILGFRKYHVFWTASLDTGGSAVNYSVKLCINDSLEVENNSCKWSSVSECMPTNVTSTSKKFSCILNQHDFFAETGEFSNYTLCVVASNNVGNAESCILAPWIAISLATPRPPLSFSADIDTERNNGDIRVTWKGRSGWQYLNTVYTVLYHAEKQPNKTKEVTNKTSFTVLNSLLPFTNYCIYLMVQTLSHDGVRSAPSDASGPICLKTPARGPSPPRNLRRSVVGVLGSREYSVFWTASLDTGGSAVNYSVKLCINDSLEVENNSCKWSSVSQCTPTNVTSTSKKFSCILNQHDFFAETREFSNYTLCVVASNEVGNAESCISAPSIASGLATPRPPLDFSANIDIERNGDIIVRWRERNGLEYRNAVYTVLYHAEKQKNKTKEVTNKTSFTVLSSLLPFTNYCIYLMVQTLSREWVRSAPSDVSGPICLKTPAGEPVNPPVVEWDQSVIFPDNADLRNVTVGWKLAKNSSWHGTPHEYYIYCHLRNSDRSPAANKCEYHIDAARNSTVLQKLNTTDSYYVYIKMRNKEGKQSGPGVPYTVKALQDNSTQPMGQGNLSNTDILWITVSVLLGCATAGVALFFLGRKWRQEIKKEKMRQGDLHKRLQLNDPCVHEYTPMDSEVQHPYDHLYVEVDRENV